MGVPSAGLGTGMEKMGWEEVSSWTPDSRPLSDHACACPAERGGTVSPPTPTSVSLQDMNGSVSPGLLLGSQRPPSTEGFPRITTKCPLLPWQTPALTASGSPCGFCKRLPASRSNGRRDKFHSSFRSAVRRQPERRSGKRAHRWSPTASGRPC